MFLPELDQLKGGGEGGAGSKIMFTPEFRRRVTGGSEAPENHVIIKESAAWRSELVDSDALESAFFR